MATVTKTPPVLGSSASYLTRQICLSCSFFAQTLTHALRSPGAGFVVDLEICWSSPIAKVVPNPKPIAAKNSVPQIGRRSLHAYTAPNMLTFLLKLHNKMRHRRDW